MVAGARLPVTSQRSVWARVPRPRSLRSRHIFKFHFPLRLPAPPPVAFPEAESPTFRGTESPAMDPQRGKATRTASKAGAAAPRVLAQGAKGRPAEPSAPAAALGAARPGAQKCSPIRASGSRRKKRASGSSERPPVRARTARAEKAPLGAEDAVEGLAAPAGKLAPPAAPGPPLPRTGSRRERGARAPRESTARREPTEVRGLGRLGPASSLRQRGPAPGAWKPRAVLEKLRLRRQEISVAAETVNGVVDHLLRRLQSCESEFQGVSLLRTGSYYEHVKVSGPAPLLPRAPSALSPACPSPSPTPGSRGPSLSSEPAQTLGLLWPVTQFQPKRGTAVGSSICTSNDVQLTSIGADSWQDTPIGGIKPIDPVRQADLCAVSVAVLYSMCPSQILTWVIRSAKNSTKLVYLGNFFLWEKLCRKNSSSQCPSPCGLLSPQFSCTDAMGTSE